MFLNNKLISKLHLVLPYVTEFDDDPTAIADKKAMTGFEWQFWFESVSLKDIYHRIRL